MRPVDQSIVAADKLGISRHLTLCELDALSLDIYAGELHRLFPLIEVLVDSDEVVATATADLCYGERLAVVATHKVLNAAPRDVVATEQGIDHIELFHGNADVAERDIVLVEQFFVV